MGKRWLGIILLAVLLTGCGTGSSGGMDELLAFRAALTGASECSFRAQIQASLGDSAAEFTLLLRTEGETMHFTVEAPESISGITGTLSAETGSLTFDDRILTFGLPAQGGLSPIAAPLVLWQSWRSGYISSWGTEDDCLRMCVDTRFADADLRTDTWLSQEKSLPIRAEICYNNQSIVYVLISDYHLS